MGERYFLTQDGLAGIEIQAPASGVHFQRLLETLRRVYPNLREVPREEFKQAEREWLLRA